LVGGAQTFAQVLVSLRTLGCDFFVTSLHKWLGAPVGNGMLIARRDRIASTWPLMAPFEDVPDRIDKYRRAEPLEGLRVSPHVYTRKSELQQFVEALDRVLG